MDAIVHDLEPVTLIGGGPCAKGAFMRAVGLAPRLVAADGGAARAMAFGRKPDAVIGDLDSLDRATAAAMDASRIHRIAEQESTDFDKALRNIDAPLVLGVGFRGGRVDHELAAFHTLLRYPARRCVLIGAQDLVFLAPPVFEISLPVASLVSLFPLGVVRGTSEGLQWPIREIEFAPDMRIGTSNAVTGPVRLTFGAAKMLIILPVATLAAVVEQLRLPIWPWPAL